MISQAKHEWIVTLQRVAMARAIVVVTHDDDLIRLGNRTIELLAGRLNGPPSAADHAAQR